MRNNQTAIRTNVHSRRVRLYVTEGGGGGGITARTRGGNQREFDDFRTSAGAKRRKRERSGREKETRKRQKKIRARLRAPWPSSRTCDVSSTCKSRPVERKKDRERWTRVRPQDSHYRARRLNRGRLVVHRDRQGVGRARKRRRGRGKRVREYSTVPRTVRAAHVAHTSRMSITFSAVIIIDHPPPFRRTLYGLSANCRCGIDLPGTKS